MLVAPFTVFAVLLISTAHAFPHYFGGYPSFYDEERPLEKPTVNVFKIYAPRLFYMPGYKPQSRNGKEEDNFSRNKQMIPDNTESILDGLMRAEAFPASLFNNEPNSVYEYGEDFAPAPSNIVSRKLPPHFGPHGPAMPMIGDFDPSIHLDNFHNPHFREGSPDYYSEMHDHHCDYHDLFNSMNDMNSDYQDYNSDGRFGEPIYGNELPPPPMESPIQIFASSSGPLTSFFKNYATIPSTNGDTLNAELLTTVTYGEPEFIQVQESNVQFPSEVTENEDSNTEIDIVFIDNMPENASVEDVEQNVVRTSLPESTFIYPTEAANDEHSTEDSVENDIPVQEIEVNIVKTILPDDSYLVSEAGGENEKIQDEMISMIQNSESAVDGSKGNVFISRYMNTPDV